MTRWAWAGVGMLVLLGLGVALTLLTLARFSDIWVVTRAVVDIDQSAGSDRGVNLTEVVNHPSAMWGRTVTISAGVENVLESRLAMIGNDALFTGDHLLIAARPGTTLFRDDTDAPTSVRVTGVARRAESATWSELDINVENVPADYGADSVLIAETVDPNPAEELGPGDKEFALASDGFDIGTTVYDLTHDGDNYLGQTVVVSGEVEEHLLTPHLFRIGDEGLLVISGVARPELFVEATAYVTGEVRRLQSAELERELGVDLDDDLLAPYENKVVVVADEVELVA